MGIFDEQDTGGTGGLDPQKAREVGLQGLKHAGAGLRTLFGVPHFMGSSGFLVDVRSTPAPLCSFCGTGIDHCALA